MVGTVAIHEAGAVADGEVGPSPPRQAQVGSGGERVSLIVVEKAERLVADVAGVQSARDNSVPLRELMRVDEPPGSEVEQSRRRCTDLPAVDAGMLQRKRKEDVGISESVMVEEISCAR